MILKRFYDEKLAQASYLVGCAATGEAIVIDPNRDVDVYTSAAEDAGVRVVAVTETHIHADFVSGSRELAARAGARLYLSAEGGADWQYTFADEAGATLIRHGDSIRIGNLRLDVVHTPGHTPEHVSFALTDTPATDRPMGIFTGDFVFVGDVGRPDLLERAAHVVGSMEPGARALFQSLQRFKQLPDYLQIWPGHGAGSACGKGLSAVPQSTIGYERLANWAFAIESEDEFVSAVLAGQPEAPTYFAQMKRINRDGPAILGDASAPRGLPASRLADVLASGALVVDTRPAATFAAGHVPGTLNIPLDQSFVTWAGWLVPYDAPFYLVIDDGATSPDVARRDLASIGLDQLAGYFGADALDAWVAAGHSSETVPSLTPAELRDLTRRKPVAIVDVRGQVEWAEGHLPGASNIPLGYLANRLDEIPTDRPVVVHCQTGARSAIAASLLRAKGRTDILNLAGGYVAWRAGGHPSEAESRALRALGAA
jgi:hydroxyacylglutathione hydrolase